MLALEIEWLMGTCWAARDPADDAPDWPPQPDRIFSALVASWGARGARSDERAALQWLEAQEPPRLEAVDGQSRTTVTSFVPPNDPGVTDIRILPDRRRRQPRQFPATSLAPAAGAHLRLIWDASADAATRGLLDAIARDTSYVGHSSAVVRCRIVDVADTAPGGLRQARATSAPYPGRLAELEALHERHLKGDERARPRPSQRARVAPARAGEPETVFGEDWIVLAHAGGERPDLLATASVARRLRDALMSGYGEDVPEWLSGHRPDGTPSTDPHLAIVPLANVGFSRSDGRLMGLGLVVPRTMEREWSNPRPSELAMRDRFERCLAALGVVDEAEEREGLALRLGKSGVWRLKQQSARGAASLWPARYAGAGNGARPARHWSSVTPIALDRHVKAEGAEQLGEMAEIVAQSCERIGLPSRPKVLVHKHAAIRGTPSAWPAGGSPHWLNWARPKSLAGRQLVHVTLEFPEEVRGPVILGAGRFFGLGLCLPIG